MAASALVIAVLGLAVAVLGAALVALVAGVLARVEGATRTGAVICAGRAFAGACLVMAAVVGSVATLLT